MPTFQRSYMKLLNRFLNRVIKRNAFQAIDKNGNITSALFKQVNGVSVSRDGNRKEEEIVEKLKGQFGKRFKGLAKLKAKICLNNRMAVIPEVQDDKYHASIYENVNKEPLSDINALILADNSKIVCYDKNVEWVRYKYNPVLKHNNTTQNLL